jgi:hypothetical protein
MNITKLELVDNGLNGVIISGVKQKQKEDGVTIFIDYNDTYKIPVPREIINKFQSLKVYMATALNVGLIGFVKDVFDKSIGNSPETVSMVNFLDSLTITKISKKDGVIRIAGKIANLDNGTIGLSTAGISPNTEYNFYQELAELFKEICDSVNEFRESKKLVKMNSRQYMLDLFANDHEQQANVENMSDEDLDVAMIQKLEAKGHIILSPDNVMTGDVEEKQPEAIAEEQVHTVTDVKETAAVIEEEF